MKNAPFDMSLSDFTGIYFPIHNTLKIEECVPLILEMSDP
jgi:hypothetical protein